MTHITVPLPESLQFHIHHLTKENFYLWMFVSQNDLWEEAKEFLRDNGEPDYGQLPFDDVTGIF